MQTSPNILKAEHLTFRIGKTAIVDDFGLEVRAGEIVGLIGPNGAGKTTTLDLLSGFSIPEEGAVSLAGAKITKMSPYRRVRHGLCRTFQEAPSIIGLTAFEHILLAHRNRSKAARTSFSMSAEPVFQSFGLTAYRDCLAETLSTSTRRLLDICRALATVPRVLLLDEPFVGLTTEDRSVVLDHVRACKARGTAVLIVEHRLPVLDQIADRVIVMVAGRAIAEGQMRDVLNSPTVQQAYLRRSVAPTSNGGCS